MKKPNFFQSGFSVMEVMIAAALLGVISVGVLNVTKNMTKSSKTYSQRTEFAQVTAQMQSILRDEYSCEATLNGLSPDGAGSDVTALKRQKGDGSTADVFTAGNAYGTGATPIFLKKMEIRNHDESSGMAEFVITMNKGRKDHSLMSDAERKTVSATAYGSPVIVQKLKVQVILDASGNIKDCLSDKDDYTTGACSMINGDFSDKVKCRSIDVAENGIDPAITASGYLQAKKGLTVGSSVTTDPGDGMAVVEKDLDVGDKAIIKNDTTITSGKLIFNDGDASIKQAAGSNLYMQNKAGTNGANVIIGPNSGARTTITKNAIAVNKNGGITGGTALEVQGNTTLIGSGTSSVTLKVGNTNIQYNGTDLVMNRPGSGKIRYMDTLTDTEVASRGFVNYQLGRALTGNSSTLNTILSNLGSLVSGSPVQAIAASTCGFYTNMTWSGGKCVDRSNLRCPSNQMMIGFSNGTPSCIIYTKTNQSCPTGQIFNGYNSSGNKICSNADTQIGNYVQGKIDDVIADNNATNTCSSKGAWFDKVSGGGRGVCRKNQDCPRSYNNGCKARHNCSGCPGGWNCSRTGGCGTWGASDQTACSKTGRQSCYCNLTSDGKSCGGWICGTCV